MKYKRFSLIEILVVIAIIAILAALLMPAITAVRNNAKKAQARAQMNAIMTAVKTYESTYGVLPIPTGYDETSASPLNTISDWSPATEVYYDQLMELLTGVRKGNLGLATTNRNSRNIRFLDVPKNYTSTDSTLYGYRDPWGNYYVIYLDSNYDGVISNAGPAENETLYGTVFIFSPGATRTTDNDDVFSWK